jgi:hypothetical protein
VREVKYKTDKIFEHSLEIKSEIQKALMREEEAKQQEIMILLDKTLTHEEKKYFMDILLTQKILLTQTCMPISQYEFERVYEQLESDTSPIAKRILEKLKN